MKVLPKINNFIKVIHTQTKKIYNKKCLLVILICIIILVCIILYRNKNIEQFTDNYDNKKYYVYWTGGFDSTFRICEMLINEHKTVQPFYITFNLDNSCKGIECRNKLWLRRNKIQEIDAMEKIRKKIIEKYPYTTEMFLPTIFIEEDVGDDHFNEKFKQKFYSNNLWPKKRKVHQYYFLAKYAEFNNINIDTGVLGIHRGSKFYDYLNNTLKYVNYNWIISDDDGPISYLNFPLFNRTKDMLFNTAKEYGYNEILKYTWSCWFPKKGKPCGKCPMCRERIISHPTSFQDNDTDDTDDTDDMEMFENNPPTNLFWTGGYDSTFRLCDLLLIHRVPVQTIYISDMIDDSNHDGIRRYSLGKEISTMKKIRKKLLEKYPFVRNLLLPTKHIKKIKLDNDIEINMQKLYNKDMLRRPTCQYGAMAQVTRNLGKDIEVCIVKNDKLHHAVKNKLICNYGECPIYERKLKRNLNKWNKSLDIFRNFIYPLYTLDKKMIYVIAKKHKFLNILKMTWSCWYPLDNGKPCGKCIMCKDRIMS